MGGRLACAGSSGEGGKALVLALAGGTNGDVEEVEEEGGEEVWLEGRLARPVVPGASSWSWGGAGGGGGEEGLVLSLAKMNLELLQG